MTRMGHWPGSAVKKVACGSLSRRLFSPPGHSDAYDSRAMHQIEPGMAVHGVRGFRIGIVTNLFEECFQVQRPREDGDPICIKSEAIFTVDKRDGVTLICSRKDVGRYSHPLHSAT